MMTVIWKALPADSILAGDRSVTVWLLLILLAAVIGAYLWGLNRREKKGHADQLTAAIKAWMSPRWPRFRTTGWWMRWRPM